MATATKAAGISPAQRKLLADKHLGKYRYVHNDPEGGRTIYPEYMGTPYWKREGMEREICTDVSAEGKLIWTHCPDAPAPDALGRGQTNRSSHEDNPAAPTPPFDYQPPAYASDQYSGGPANFDGNAGGNNNPRNPRLEGEQADQYLKELDSFRKALAESVELNEMLSAEVQELKDMINSPEPDKLKAFAEKLKAK